MQGSGIRIHLRPREMCHGFGLPEADPGFPVQGYKGLSLIHATKQQDDVELFRFFAETPIPAVVWLPSTHL